MDFDGQDNDGWKQKRDTPRVEKAAGASKPDPSWLTTERIPDNFDPYRVWLGIPKGKRPPTHYQLLRISPREQADEVIEAAAERQSEYVHKCRIGEYATFADRLLYEIQEARHCLLNPQLRKDYDEKLAEGKRKPVEKRVIPPPGKPVGEGNEIATTYFKIVSILLGAFIIMAVITFMLPWKKVVFSKSKNEVEAANVPAPLQQAARAPAVANAPQIRNPPANQPAGLPDKQKPLAAKARANGCRVVWEISETGDCTIRLSRPPERTDNRETRSFTKVKQNDGTWECEHLFLDKDALESLSGRSVQNVTIEDHRHSLLMTPKSASGYKFNIAEIAYPNRVRLPLTLAIDIDEMGADGKFQVNLTCSTPPNLHPFLDLQTNDSFKSKATINVGWIASRDAKGDPSFENLLQKDIDLTSSFEGSFRLPLPNTKIDDLFEIHLGRFGDSVASISRVAVRGRLAPNFGIGWKQRGNVVFAGKVNARGPADRGGLQVGDVLVSVNGEKTTTPEHAVQLMQGLPVGGKCTLVIARGKKQMSLDIVGE